jgi:hypothetical protein
METREFPEIKGGRKAALDFSIVAVPNFVRGGLPHRDMILVVMDVAIITYMHKNG